MSALQYASPDECKVSEVRRTSITENLQSKKVSLERQLREVNEALAALNEHPEVIKVLELLAKTGRI